MKFSGASSCVRLHSLPTSDFAFSASAPLRMEDSPAGGWKVFHGEKGTGQVRSERFHCMGLENWESFFHAFLQVLCFVHLLNELRAVMALSMKDSSTRKSIRFGVSRSGLESLLSRSLS